MNKRPPKNLNIIRAYDQDHKIDANSSKDFVNPPVKRVSRQKQSDSWLFQGEMDFY